MENVSGNISSEDNSFVEEEFKTPPQSPKSTVTYVSKLLEKPVKSQPISKVSSDSSGNLIKTKIELIEFAKELTVSIACLQDRRGNLYKDLKEIREISGSSDFFSFNFKVKTDGPIKNQRDFNNMLLHAKLADKLIFSLGIDHTGKVIKCHSDFILEPEKISLLFSNSNPFAPPGDFSRELTFSVLFSMPKEEYYSENDGEYYLESDDEYSDPEIEWQPEITQGRAFFERPSKKAKIESSDFSKGDDEQITPVDNSRQLLRSTI